MRTTGFTTNTLAGDYESQHKGAGIETERDLIEEEMVGRHLRELKRGYSLDVCCSCGCEIRRGERQAKVYSTGDIIHEECWSDYAEDNFYELCYIPDIADDGAPDGFFGEE